MKKHKCPCENPAEESDASWWRRANFETAKPVNASGSALAEILQFGKEFSVRIGVPKPNYGGIEWILQMGRKFGGDSLDMEQAGAVIESTIPRSQWSFSGQNALDLYAGRPAEQKNVVREKVWPPRKTFGWVQVRRGDTFVEDRPILNKQGDFVVYASANEGDVPKGEISYTVHNMKTGRSAKRDISGLKKAIEIAKQLNGD